MANPVSRLATLTEVNLLSRILLSISLAEPKVKSKTMSPTDPVEEEEKAEAEVEAELRSEKEEENLGCHTPFRDSGNEGSIRVPRMFHSYV